MGTSEVPVRTIREEPSDFVKRLAHTRSANNNLLKESRKFSNSAIPVVSGYALTSFEKYRTPEPLFDASHHV